MKGRDSGMPDRDYWETFFDPDCIMDKLVEVAPGAGTIVEFGSGYGTFTIPLAKRTPNPVVAFDIEPDLVDMVGLKAKESGIGNLTVEYRDFAENGTGLPSGSAAHVMIYNLLHIDSPVDLLEEALRILKPGGSASIIHWRRDIQTPRGPSMDIRPSPEQCREWAETAGFVFSRHVDLSECCRYHYGLLVERPNVGE